MADLIRSYWSGGGRAIVLVEGKKSASIHGFSNHFQIKKRRNRTQWSAIADQSINLPFTFFRPYFFKKPNLPFSKNPPFPISDASPNIAFRLEISNKTSPSCCFHRKRFWVFFQFLKCLLKSRVLRLPLRVKLKGFSPMAAAMFSIMFMVTYLRFRLSMFLLCDPLVEVLMVLFGKIFVFVYF